MARKGGGAGPVNKEVGWIHIRLSQLDQFLTEQFAKNPNATISGQIKTNFNEKYDAITPWVKKLEMLIQSRELADAIAQVPDARIRNDILATNQYIKTHLPAVKALLSNISAKAVRGASIREVRQDILVCDHTVMDLFQRAVTFELGRLKNYIQGWP